MKKFFVMGVAALVLSSCFADNEPVETDNVDDRVTLSLFARTDDYSLPETRTGTAPKDGAINSAQKPFVMVYKGTDKDATIEEIAQAYTGSDGKTYVRLKRQSEPCRIFIFYNPTNDASNRITYGTDYSWLVPLTSSHLESYYGPGNPKTLGSMSVYLRTFPLSTTDPITSITAVPYTGSEEYIPMSCVHPVSKIDETTKLGEPGDLLQLKRVISKIIVNSKADNFELLGATVTNAPNRGYFFRADGQAYAADAIEAVNYAASSGDPVTGIAAAAAGTSPINETTAANPIYVYDCTAAEIANKKMAVIVKATYNSTDYYYRMALIDSDGGNMNLERNYQYTFTITSVSKPGFLTYAEAVAATTTANDGLYYTLSVTEQNMTDIYENGRYYLAASNSEVLLYSDLTKTGLVAVTVATNASGSTVRTVRVESTGVTLVNPAPDPETGIGTLPYGTTDIKIRVNSTASFGTVIINIDDFEKRIPVVRKEIFPNTGGKVRFPVSGANPYIGAFSQDDWIVFSYDGTDDTDKLNTEIYTADYSSTGGFWMHIKENPLLWVEREDGVVYLSPLNNSSGRIKLIVDQLY